MKAHLAVLALFAVTIASIGMAPAFGQIVGPIEVTTDKPTYSEGETILVTGEVRDLHQIPVTVIVKAPNGNLVTIAQVTVGADKKFSTEVKAGGSLMKAEGTYIVTAQYGDKDRSATAMFEFSGSTATPPPTPEIPVEDTDTTIAVDGSDDLIKYTITGGKLISIMPDLDLIALVITIDAETDGSLMLTIPRSILDATFNDLDGAFIVLVDGVETEFDEGDSTPTERMLTIPFPAGAEQIEIVGTFVIPEFGAIAAMILAVAIISIIAVSAKSRLSIVPRY